jgi:hypothetical protein
VGSSSPGPDFGLIVLPPTKNTRSEVTDMTFVDGKPCRCSDVQAQVPIRAGRAPNGTIPARRAKSTTVMSFSATNEEPKSWRI